MKGIPVWWGISHFNHFHFRSDLKKKEIANCELEVLAINNSDK